jgi:hypothetical protein
VNADVERFIEECRADPWFRKDPEGLDHMEEVFETFYRAADETPAWQDFWDRIREIVTQRNRSLNDRFAVLVPIMAEIIALLD